MEHNQSGRFLAIARILRPQGRKGEVAAEILTNFPRRFEQLQVAWVQVPSRDARPMKLQQTWPHKGQVILKFEGVDSIEVASTLRGAEVLIPWEERTALPVHTYYWCELQGCRVMWESKGREIGTVVEVESTGGVDVLHVKTPDGKNEVLIPLAQEICTRIDPATKTIVIEPPEDLIELNG